MHYTSNFQQMIHSRTESVIIFEFLAFEDADQWNFFSNKHLWGFISTGHWKIYYPTNYREGKFLLALHVHLQIYNTLKAAPRRPRLLSVFRAKYLFLPVICESKKSYFLVLEHWINKDKSHFMIVAKCQLAFHSPTDYEAKDCNQNLSRKYFFS